MTPVTQGLQANLDAALSRVAHRVSPFYRQYPYSGPLWLTEVDTRGAISGRHRFFFNRVPKAANSTVTSALVQRAAAVAGKPVPAGKEKWYFDRPLFASPATVRDLDRSFYKVAFVRDPFSRTLSAFLDKILGRRVQSRNFYRWWTGAAAPGFGDFCRYLSQGGLHHDIHWAPQTAILLLPVQKFDRIGRFETLDADLAEVLAAIFGDTVAGSPAVGRAGPRTDANAAMSMHYDDETLALVERLYGRDLDTFGYARPNLG